MDMADTVISGTAHSTGAVISGAAHSACAVISGTVRRKGAVISCIERHNETPDAEAPGALSGNVSLNWCEIGFISATERAYPVIREIFKCSSGCDAVLRIAYLGIIYITAGSAFIFFHKIPSFLVPAFGRVQVLILTGKLTD